MRGEQGERGEGEQGEGGEGEQGEGGEGGRCAHVPLVILRGSSFSSLIDSTITPLT